MTKLPPDIKELKEAEKIIADIQKLMSKVDTVLDVLKDAGPQTVLAPAATHYKNLCDLETLLEEARLRVYHIKNGYQFHVLPPLFHDASTDTTKTLNGYTVNISDDMSVSIPADRKADAYDWLDKNGYGDIIQSTINSSTLKATVKGMYKDGVVVPEDVFKVTALKKYRVYQSSKKIPEAAGGGEGK